MEARLERGHLEKLVEYFLWIRVFLEFNNNTDLATSRLIPKVTNCHELFIFDELSDFFDKRCFVDRIRHFSNNNTVTAFFALFDIRYRANCHATTARLVRLLHRCTTINSRASWKIRTLYIT